MGRTVKRLSNLEIDEISLVDRPANQHGLVEITKRHQEEGMSVYDADGVEVFQEDLPDMVGQFVYDDEGVEYQVGDAPPEDADYDQYEQEELEPVGKAGINIGQATRRLVTGEGSGAMGAYMRKNPKKFAGYTAGAAGAAGAAGGYAGSQMSKRAPKSAGQTVLEQLSKALNDEDRDQIIAKAVDRFDEIEKRADALEVRLDDMLEAQRFGQFQTVAKGYELGEEDGIANLLLHASESLPPEDLQLLDRVLTATGEFSKSYFEEVGVAHAFGQNSDVIDQVFAMAGEAVSKNAEMGLTQEQAVTAIFAANPDAYDEYESEQRYNR